MIHIKIFEDGEEIRDVEVDGRNFLIVHNGTHGPIYDKENFEYLRIDDKHVIRQIYLDIIKALYTKFDRYLYTLWPELICCMVDQEWQPSKRANKNSNWKNRHSKSE